MHIGSFDIKGAIDQETRCRHYHKETDRIAIKFFCCGEYFPCHQCHAEEGCGRPRVWPRARFSEKAVLCGHCHEELSVWEYLNCGYNCPKCGAAFNPGCGLHRELYFETSER